MDLHLDGRTALVSGSTGGIGFAVAGGLAQMGATVIVNGRSAERVAAAIERLRSEHGGARFEAAAFDLSSARGVDALVAAFPSVDVLSTISASSNRSRSKRSPTPTGCASSKPTS